MPDYEQTIVFRKKFTCTAANAQEAMTQIEDYIGDVGLDYSMDDVEYCEFEDEEPESDSEKEN